MHQSSAHSAGRKIFISEFQGQQIVRLDHYFSGGNSRDGNYGIPSQIRLKTGSDFFGDEPTAIVPHSPSIMVLSVAARILEDLGDSCIPQELDLEVMSLFFVYWRALFQRSELVFISGGIMERLEYLSAVTAKTLMSRHSGWRPETAAYSQALSASDQLQLPTSDQEFLFCNYEYQCLVSRLKRYIETTSTGDISSRTRLNLTSCLSASGTSQLLLNWDPITFLNEQYGVGHSQKLADCVCISGTPVSAFASTCLEYLRLISPTIGTATLHLLDAWLAQTNPNSFITGKPFLCSNLLSSTLHCCVG